MNLYVSYRSKGVMSTVSSLKHQKVSVIRDTVGSGRRIRRHVSRSVIIIFTCKIPKTTRYFVNWYEEYHRFITSSNTFSYLALNQIPWYLDQFFGLGKLAQTQVLVLLPIPDSSLVAAFLLCLYWGRNFCHIRKALLCLLHGLK